MSQFFHIRLDISIQRFPVGENKNQLNDFFIGAGSEKAVKTIGQPTDGQGFPGPG